MTRPILLSNGTLHVGINLYGMVHDLYYPHVGQENHSAAHKMRHKVGVWIDGNFSWLDDGAWTFNMSYDPHGLVGHITAHHDWMQVTLEFTDCVDSEWNVFMRDVKVVNGSDKPREIRLFMHQMLFIGSNITPDTAQYLPEQSAILHYKGRRAFVFGGKDASGKPFSQFSIGLFGIEGHEGVFKDAEDGLLSGNVVEFGQVDSIFGFNLNINALDSSKISYWLTAARTQREAIVLHSNVQKIDMSNRFERTLAYWQKWLEPAEKYIANLPKNLQTPFRNSLLIVKSQVDHQGGVLASTDTTMLNYTRDSYAYCWPRDGALSLWPLMRLGYKTELLNHFSFCRQGMHPDGFLLHKYQPDGAIGSSWHAYLAQGRIIPPIQEDETAIAVFLFCEYMRLSNDKMALDEYYDSLVVPMCNFMAGYIDPQTKLPHASYDLWEEKFATHTYTVAVVYAALSHAANLAIEYRRPADATRWKNVAESIKFAAPRLLYRQDKKYFCKGFINHGNDQLEYDDTIDSSSLYGAVTFGLLDFKTAEAKAALETLRKLYGIDGDNPTVAGRYQNDAYDRAEGATNGNPWFITTLWQAQFDMSNNKPERAEKTINWVSEHMLSTGVLSEQFNPFNYKFISVAPLTWSQAEFLTTILDRYQEK